MADAVEVVRSEIEGLHEFFVGWFSGALPRADFEAGFLARFAPDLLLIPPAGTRMSLDQLAEAVQSAHATNSEFRIEIRNVTIRRRFEGHILATYEEWQRNALASTPPDNARIATVLFRDTRPLRWLHIHETWMPESIGFRPVTDASAQRDPKTTVSEYFARMRAGDPSVVELFHENARLIGLGKVTQGKQAIAEFYEHVIGNAGPTPQIIGDPLTAGSRVAVEIVIELSGGATVHAIDLFEVEDGRIRSLSYFLATH